MLQVCDIVLGDKTVDRDTRRRRAEALRDLSNIFQVNRRLNTVQSVSARRRCTSAAFRCTSAAAREST